MNIHFGTIPNLNTVTHTVITVGSTTTPVIASNENRVYLLLVNDSDEVIYLKLGAEAVNREGIRLDPNGASLELSPAYGNLCTCAINAISASGNKKLLVTEG